jgi:DNA-binding transcriptional regulator PaaX
MRLDPLLPAQLHPADYLGRQVWDLHNKLRTKIAHEL